jgi:hypothetical protein
MVNPALFGVDAVRFTFTDDPSHGQGSLAQMEDHTQNQALPQGNILFTRLYVSPTNPYPNPAPGPFPNYQTYQQVIADSQAGSYQLTVANDNNLWGFKTLSSANPQVQNILIREAPVTAAIQGKVDANLGGVGVRVIQSGDAAALQYYLANTKPYDFSWRSALGPWAAGSSRPNNISIAIGKDALTPIGDNEAGTIFFNWVMGSNQVQSFSNELTSESNKSGNESFGVLAWDAIQNKYVMLSPTNVTATPDSVGGTMPIIGNGQTAFFGMHTHLNGDVIPSLQDIHQASSLGIDQIIINNQGGSQAIILPYGQESLGPLSSTFAFNQSSMTNVYGQCDSCGTAGKKSSSPFVTVTGSRGIVGGVPVAGAAGLQTGFYVTINKETGEIVDVGFFGSAEFGTGLGLGKGIAGGVTFGSASGVLNGHSGVVNVMTPWGGVSINYNEAGEITGITGSGPGFGVTWGKQYSKTISIFRQDWATSAETYSVETGDANHAPNTQFSDHVNGFV